jgi:hypothetical protein
MKLITLILVLLVSASPLLAETVTVEFIGEVEYNQIQSGVFADVNAGDEVYAAFYVDSDVYVDSPNYNVRGYTVDLSSFILHIGSVGPVGLVDPQPYGPAYFCLRESDPVDDGFHFANEIDWASVVPSLDEPGQLDPYFSLRWEVGYTGDTLTTLDILDALGTYGYAKGLTSFYTVIHDAWADAMGLIYGEIRISTGLVANETMSIGEVKNLFR